MGGAQLRVAGGGAIRRGVPALLGASCAVWSETDGGMCSGSRCLPPCCLPPLWDGTFVSERLRNALGGENARTGNRDGMREEGRKGRREDVLGGEAERAGCV